MEDNKEMSKRCYILCDEYGVSCPCTDCRHWIDYSDDRNCAIIAANENEDGLYLVDIAQREGLTIARIGQIEKAAMSKVENILQV